jgi:putative hydrolase
VGSYFDLVELDARRLARRLREGAMRLASRSIPPEERNPVYLLASPDQRSLMDQIQALMAVVEGHGNFVMDHVGARVIPSFRRMRWIFERRRQQTTGLQRAFNHAIGLEMKLRQYEIGREFCDGVAAAGGVAALGRLWEDEDGFPTLAEVRDPQSWLRRVA